MRDDRQIKVLLVEDEPIIRMVAVDVLEDAGMLVVEAGTSKEALAQLSTHDIDVIVSDIGLPDMSGFEFAVESRRSFPGMPVVFATGDRFVDGADALGNNVVLGKPYTDEDLISAIRSLVVTH